MMKDIVVTLLTTTINRYSELKFSGNSIPREMITKDLTSILDYIADISEEDKQPITVVLNHNTNIVDSREYVRELEEACEANNEVIRQQWEKIIKFEVENKELKIRLGALYGLENVGGTK
ncbi:hypothetical protein NRP93_000455 [Clostridium botulinum]|nr:hypothetical protein [Clostridium botulinum]